MSTPPLGDLLPALFGSLNADLSGWLRAFARLMPTLVLVPALGGGALPPPVRAGLGLALAVAVAPALGPVGAGHGPLALVLLAEVARGTPPAVGASVLVYAALMAGGVIDDVRGSRGSMALPVFQGAATPMGTLLGLLVTIAFLEMGGTARVIAALFAPSPGPTLAAAVVARMTGTIGLAVAVASPVVAVSIMVGVAEALVTRAAVPAHITWLIAPLRGVVVLAVTLLLLDRMLPLFTFVPR
jgi:flagellar biosynthesis protein FliR